MHERLMTERDESGLNIPNRISARQRIHLATPRQHPRASPCMSYLRHATGADGTFPPR